MTKKHVIILSVLVNAGLLVMLCIGALTSREKAQNFDVAKNEEKVATVLYDAKTVDQVNSAATNEAIKENDPVVHKLPEAVSPFSYANEPAQTQEPIKQDQPVAMPTPPSLPAVAEVQPSVQPKKDQEDYYTIQVGDNPWTVAMKHHMKVSELLKLNHLDSKSAKRLRPGHRLRIH